MLSRLKFVFTLTITLSYSSFSAEVDHFSERNIIISDSSERVNTLANKMLAQAVKTVNQTRSCSQSSLKEEKYLKKELTKYFANHIKGKLVITLLKDKTFDLRRTQLANSVYKDWSIWDGYLLGKKSAKFSPLAITPLIKIGNQEVGIDKFEHMFGMGKRYFESFYYKGKSLKKTLKNGIFKEKTILGGNVLATGVFAYSDLSANFNGMRFWNHMLQKRDDVLGDDYNIGPYIKCNNSKWEVVKSNPIDFRNYMDASMDESINCSKLASSNGVEKFKSALDNLGMKCPMDLRSLVDMRIKYNVIPEDSDDNYTIAHWILNLNGIDKLNFFNEF